MTCYISVVNQIYFNLSTRFKLSLPHAFIEMLHNSLQPENKQFLGQRTHFGCVGVSSSRDTIHSWSVYINVFSPQYYQCYGVECD